MVNRWGHANALSFLYLQKTQGVLCCGPFQVPTAERWNNVSHVISYLAHVVRHVTCLTYPYVLPCPGAAVPRL